MKLAKLPELMQQAIEWLVLLQSGELSEAETHAFADWLSQDIEHIEAFSKAEDLLNDSVIAAQSPRGITKTPASKPDQNVIPINPAQHRRSSASVRGFRWLAIPLSLAAAWLFAVLLILPEQLQLLDNIASDYHTSTRELRDIQLADGSHLLLNTNTAVSVDYSDSLRHITLHHGQAQFTVAKDTDRPFEVGAGELAIRALGTIFEVYQPDSAELSIIVKEHAVSARLQNRALKTQDTQDSQVEIKEGQRLRYTFAGPLTTPEEINLAQASAWQQRRLFMNNRPLAELISELNRYRIGRIFISDPEINNLRITGAFSLENPDETLAKLSNVLALQETRVGSWWVLLHR